MFTGIIEDLGTITKIKKDGTNYHFTIKSKVSKKLKIDQSIAHDGCCLTVVEMGKNKHTVTAIKETIDKTNLSTWKKGRVVNLERAMQSGGRLDGHIVQGHVDTTGSVKSVKEVDGSWYFTFKIKKKDAKLLVDKGSVTINGTSLTVCDPTKNTFSVAIIPYTYKNTVFRQLKKGDPVNLEFDILGKYIFKMIEPYIENMKK